MVWVVPEDHSQDAEGTRFDYTGSHGQPANYGVAEIQVLKGNVGYLRLSNFSMDEMYESACKAIDRAMACLQDSDSFILDLRGNPGGGGRLGAYLASYFYGSEPVHLDDYHIRGRRPIEVWTHSELPGKRMSKIPLRILIDAKSFSAAESIAYQLKHLKRAEIVGEVSGGGAHGGRSYTLGHRLEIYIPFSHSVHPVTQTDFEKVGVIPDVQVASPVALEVAYQRALAELLEKSTDAKSKNFLEKIVENSKFDSKKQELNSIRETLVDYIEGSTNGQPDRLRKVFHPNLNLYSVRDQRLQVWAGKDYIQSTKQGVPTGETGRILAIDYANDIAMAKVEVAPKQGAKFIDYFMLLKIKGRWTIVHKMYSRENGNSGADGTWHSSRATAKDPRVVKFVQRKTPASTLKSRIDLVAQQMREAQHLPGLAVIVVREGKTVLKRGYGWANVEKETPVDVDKSIFRIGSISKALTLLTLTRQIDRSLIQRDTNVEEIFGPIPNPNNFRNPITVDHLLTHTTGLDQIGINRHVRDHHLSHAQRISKRVNLRTFLLSNNLRRVNEPGELYRYDTYGTSLAGNLLEQLHSQPFKDVMRRELFSVLGMENSFVEVDEQHRKQLAVGYGFRDGKYTPEEYEIYVTTPASSVDASPADMGRLLEALTSDGANDHGRLLSPAMMQRVLAPQFRVHSDFCGASHGLFESWTSDEGTTDVYLRTLGHGGDMAGYRAALTLIPEKQIGVFFVTNRSPSAGGGMVDFRPLIDVVCTSISDTPRKKKYAIPNPPEPTQTALAEYIGDYYYNAFCHTITVADQAAGAWTRGRGVQIQVEGQRLKIRDEFYVHRGEDVFVESGGNRLVKFCRNNSGKVTHFCYSTSPDTFEIADENYREFESLAQSVYELALDGKVAEALKFFQQENGGPHFYSREEEFNNAGYALLQQNDPAAATAIFELNTKMFPDSWNAHDSLGDGYRAAGRSQQAISSYTRSLELNPKNAPAKEKIEELSMPPIK